MWSLTLSYWRHDPVRDNMRLLIMDWRVRNNKKIGMPRSLLCWGPPSLAGNGATEWAPSSSPTVFILDSNHTCRLTKSLIATSCSVTVSFPRVFWGTLHKRVETSTLIQVLLTNKTLLLSSCSVTVLFPRVFWGTLRKKVGRGVAYVAGSDRTKKHNLTLL